MPQTWDTVNCYNPSVYSFTSGDTIVTKILDSDVAGLVPGTLAVSSGRIYWETIIVGSGFTSGYGAGQVGIINSASPPILSAVSIYTSGQNGMSYGPSGDVTSNGSTLATIATFNSGTGSTPVTICHAMDLINHKYWFRPGIAANWNNDVIGNQNPATNTGGIAIPSAVYTSAVLPATELWTASTADAATGLFVFTSWTGTAPSGFTDFDGNGGAPPPSGWPNNNVIVFAGGRAP